MGVHALALLALSVFAGDPAADPAPSPAAKFRREAETKGLELRLKLKKGRLVTSDDIFYGRHIFRVPRSSVLSNETLESATVRGKMRDLLAKLEAEYNITSTEEVHLVSTALALLTEARLKDQSRFAPWLAAVANTSLLVLELTERQRTALVGTTVEGAYEDMQERVDLVHQTAGNLSFAGGAVSRSEAAWAVAVILKHARTVHPPFDEVNKRPARMCLLAVPELVPMEVSVNEDLTITFQEELMRYGENKQHEGYFVTQIARTDMIKGTPVAVWPGHLSNSELILRHGKSFPDTRIGIGRNVSQPPNWSPSPNAPIMEEYGKYNCSSLESFELRFNAKGKPSMMFVRCYRVSWLMANGWYSPMVEEKMRMLDKWPPPKRYKHDDWLSWTQADLDLNKVILQYCDLMKSKLDEQDFELHEALAASTEPNDVLVAAIVRGEREAFGNCIIMAEKVGGKRPVAGQVRADGSKADL